MMSMEKNSKRFDDFTQALLDSDICDVEDGIALNPLDTKVHCETTVGDIVEVLKQVVFKKIKQK